MKWQKYLIGETFAIVSFAVFYYFQPTSLGSNQMIPFDSDRWEITAKESRVENYLGQKSLLLKGGFAVVKDSEFTDGIIEFDIAFTGERGFMGGLWRVQDLGNYEKYYMRPHQSGNPDASQYAPVYNTISSWQLYYGDGYSGQIKYPMNQWVQVKIVVAGKNAEVYVQDMSKPLLFVNELKRETKSGKVGLLVEDFAPGHFANFSYTSISNPPLQGKAKPPDNGEQSNIRAWFVSNSFDEKTLDGKFSLNPADKEKLTWRKFNAEDSGMLNLAQAQGIEKGKNCAFARITINSDREQVKKLKFGFSDRIKVYFNNQLLYSGHDEFQSRDYRFLGTVGYWDELYLPLKKGENELWMAVTETPTKGGWGLKATFENPAGISLLD